MHSEQILQKIKNENLRPISRSVFLFRKVSIWFLLAISTIFGAYAFAFFFLKTLYIDYDNWHYFASSYNRFLIENIPLIWVVLFILSLLLIFYLFKKTNKGYKYSIVFIGAGSLIISFSLGVVLSKILAQKGYFIEEFENERVMNWTDPESGRLSGEVLFSDDQYILLRDIKDDVWNVNTIYLLDNSKEVLQNNQLVSVIGRYDYENNFTACQIIPLNIDKMRFKPNPKNRPGAHLNQDNSFVNDICDLVINGK
ncbi:hypothetical protein H7X65_02200 [Candidatus Parcubacteria bacterium]|nr:hypothetical protein [Candidatus Parcubacteria bacterium]